MQKLLIDIPDDYEHRHIDIMSNFDHFIDQEVSDLCNNENIVVGYPALNFYANVWYNKNDNKWYGKVWQYHSHIDTIIADSPDELRVAISDEYGYE